MQVKVFGLLLVVGLFTLTSCRPHRYKVTTDPAVDYRAYTIEAASMACDKMIKCYKKIYRNVSPELQKQITVETCKANILSDLDEKLSIQTESMRKNSILCYNSLLDSECQKIAVISMYSPSCVQLRDESNRVFAILKEKKLRDIMKQ